MLRPLRLSSRDASTPLTTMATRFQCIRRAPRADPARRPGLQLARWRVWGLLRAIGVSIPPGLAMKVPQALGLALLLLPTRAAAFAPLNVTVREERGVE